MSLSTRGMPQTICPSSLSISKATPNTQLEASSGSETRVGEMSSGPTFALGLRILTEDGSFCMERGHEQQMSQIQKSLIPSLQSWMVWSRPFA